MLPQSLLRGFACVKKMFGNSQPITKTLSLLGYQQFFRQMNKSYEAEGTIKIFERHIKAGEESAKYLALTLRMFTRILRKGVISETHMINHFIEKHFTAIKAIEGANLPIDDLKNVMLFAISHVSSNKGIISNRFVEFASRILNLYLQKFQELQLADQRINIQIIISSIGPISTSFSDLTDSYSSVLLEFLIKQKEDLVMENLTFLSALEALEHCFTAKNTAIFAFVQEITAHILRKKMIPTFEHTTLAYLINLCCKCREEAKVRDIRLQPQIEQIIIQIDQYFIDTLSGLSGHSIEVVLPLLLKNNLRNKFVSHYYSIIALSINQRGQACLQPLLIIRSISYLSASQTDLLTKVTSNWQQNFVKMLTMYYHSKNKFEKNITDFLLQISIKGLLQGQHQLAFRKFCDQFRPYKKHIKALQNDQHTEMLQTNKYFQDKVEDQAFKQHSKAK